MPFPLSARLTKHPDCNSYARNRAEPQVIGVQWDKEDSVDLPPEN